MIITTARKPSSKTRTFCKHLAMFTGWEYLTRGKSSLTMLGNDFLLVGERRGNPRSLKFFSEGRCVLSILFNVSLDKEVGKGETPVIEGKKPLALALSKVTGFKKKKAQRIIRVNDNMEFIDKGTPYIVLKVLAVSGNGLLDLSSNS